jgi:hypothetical protein
LGYFNYGPGKLKVSQGKFFRHEALDKSLTVFEEARALRGFKEARPDFVPFGTKCGKEKKLS